MADISLLPDEMKKKTEEDRKKREKNKTVAPDISLYVPSSPAPAAPPAKSGGADSVIPPIKPPTPKPLALPPPPPPPASAPKIVSSPPKSVPPPKPVAQPVVPPPSKPAPVKPVSNPPKPAPLKTAPSVQLSSPKDPSSSVLRVSLMPSDQVAQSKDTSGRNTRNMIIMIGAAVVLIVLMYVGLRLFVMQRQGVIRQLNTALADVNQRIRETEAAVTNPRRAGKQLAAAKTLLGDHILWTKFFRFLEDNTLPDVGFTQLRSDTVGVVTLEAEAVSYASAAAQIMAFRQASDAVLAVETGGMSADVADNGTLRGVRFTLVLRLRPEFLQAATPGAAL